METQEALAARALDSKAAAAARRDALAVLIVRAQEEGGEVDRAACGELALEVLEGSAPATVRRHALWLLAHAHPASEALSASTAAMLQVQIDPTTVPRVRVVALRTAAWLVGRKHASLPAALIAASWDGLSCSVECVRLATLDLVATVACALSAASSLNNSTRESHEEQLQELAKGVGWVGNSVTDGSVAVRVAAARALGRLHCVRGRLTDARWLALVIAPTNDASGSAAHDADDASAAVDNAVTRKRRRRERQLVARAQQKEHAAKEAKAKDTDPMTDWLIPDQACEGATVEEEEEDGEVSEPIQAQASEQDGVGALGMALDDASWKVRRAAVQALRMLCCAQPTNAILNLDRSEPNGQQRVTGKRKWNNQKKVMGTADWDVPLQLSRRVLVYLHDMVGDMSTCVQISALRAVRAVLIAHQTARPPLALSDRQLQALVSPSLLDADQQQLLRKARMAPCSTRSSGWSGLYSMSVATGQNVGVSLAAHRLLGSAVHPSGSTVHRTLRALARAAAARDDFVTNQHHQQGQCGVQLAMGEVKSVFQAAAALGKQAENAGQIHLGGMGGLLGINDTAKESECTEDDGANIAAATISASSDSHSSERGRENTGDAECVSPTVDSYEQQRQRTLMEQCVAWVAVFHAAVDSPQLQAELPPHLAGTMYATIASAEHYGGQMLLPPPSELRGCEALASIPTYHEVGEEQASASEDGENLGRRQTAEQLGHALTGAAEHAMARMRTACARAVQAALAASASAASHQGRQLNAVELDESAADTSTLADAESSGPDVSTAVAQGTAVLQQVRQMVSALLIPYSLPAAQSCDASKLGAESPGVSQCRYTMGFAGLATTLLRLIRIVAGRDLTGRQQGDAAAWQQARSEAEAGLRATEELLQSSYELQYGFVFGFGQGANENTRTAAALHEIEMRQVRLFAHVASVILASCAADCRPALRRVLSCRIAGLRSTITKASSVAAADSHAAANSTTDIIGCATAWNVLLDAAAKYQHQTISRDDGDSVRSREERKQQAAELLSAVWSAVMQIFQNSSSESNPPGSTDNTQTVAQSLPRPKMCFAALNVLQPGDSPGTDAKRSSSIPTVVLSTLPWQLRLQMRLWNVPADASLALRVTLQRLGKPAQGETDDDGSFLTLPLAALQLPKSQGQTTRSSAAVCLPLPLDQQDDPISGQSLDAAPQTSARDLEWDDYRAELAASTRGAESTRIQHACNDADITETDATLILPVIVRSGLYKASMGLVRLFGSEIEPKKLAPKPPPTTTTTPQHRDIRRGMVCISEISELQVTIASR